MEKTIFKHFRLLPRADAVAPLALVVSSMLLVLTGASYMECNASSMGIGEKGVFSDVYQGADLKGGETHIYMCHYSEALLSRLASVEMRNVFVQSARERTYLQLEGWQGFESHAIRGPSSTVSFTINWIKSLSSALVRKLVTGLLSFVFYY